MADISNEQRGGRDKKPRRKKLSTKVDLTPMVDLGFLLITFFVFTTSMAKPKALGLNLPAPSTNYTPTGETATLTIFPMANNKMFYYHGELNKAVENHLYGITNYDYDKGLGSIIRVKQEALDRSEGKYTRKDFTLVIKPLPEASYQNVVDILDETLINKVGHYFFVDPDADDKKMLDMLGIQHNN
ncbi:MAG: biopolymer transporter ExbD [Bacteroidota bacterium]|nr:biopolymer transporter ExbD [Bacteroidota bacterium]